MATKRAFYDRPSLSPTQLPWRKRRGEGSARGYETREEAITRVDFDPTDLWGASPFEPVSPRSPSAVRCRSSGEGARYVRDGCVRKTFERASRNAERCEQWAMRQEDCPLRLSRLAAAQCAAQRVAEQALEELIE